jgi:hypothetical protein
VFGGALLYGELTGRSIAVAKYWPLALVGLGIELILAQAVAGRADDAVRVRLSALAIIGLIVLLATAPATGTPWGMSCMPFSQSCSSGNWPANVEYRGQASPMFVDWTGVGALGVNLRFGSIDVRPATQTASAEVTVQVVGHSSTAAGARAITDSAGVSVERDGPRLVLTGGYTKPSEGSSDYADINLVITLPPGVELDLVNEYGPVSVQGIQAHIAVDTRMAGITIVDAAEVTAESDHGRIEVRRASGAVAIHDTYGAVTVAEIGGPLTIESKHGPVDVRGAAGELKITANYGAINVRYAGQPGGNATLTNTYGSITLEHPAASGYELDATADRSRISTNLPGLAIDWTVGSGSTAQAVIRDGGPLITVRNGYGRIDIRSF